jgi:hypothetical protein
MIGDAPTLDEEDAFRSGPGGAQVVAAPKEAIRS